jgi:hypothetical protein
MAYRPYVWRKTNPEKRLEQKRREKVRRALRDKGILPPVGEPMNEEQSKIDTQISNNDFSYWDSIKTQTKRNGGKQTKIPIKDKEYIVWYRSKENAKKKKIEFNLDIEDIVIPEYCPYLNMELIFDIEDNDKPNYYSIDRIDNSKGYVKGNIQIISMLANTMKNKATQEQLITFSENCLKIHPTQNL